MGPPGHVGCTGGCGLLGSDLLASRVESRSIDPLIPLGVLASRSLIGGNLVIVAIGIMAFGGISFMLTLYAQGVLGYSASAFGVMTSVNAAMAMAGSYTGQKMVTAFAPRPVAAVSLLLTALACAYLTQIDARGNYVVDMLPGLVIFGVGLGISKEGSMRCSIC